MAGRGGQPFYTGKKARSRPRARSFPPPYFPTICLILAGGGVRHVRLVRQGARKAWGGSRSPNGANAFRGSNHINSPLFSILRHDAPSGFCNGWACDTCDTCDLGRGVMPHALLRRGAQGHSAFVGREGQWQASWLPPRLSAWPFDLLASPGGGHAFAVHEDSAAARSVRLRCI